MGDKDLIEQRMQKLMFKMGYWDKEFSTTHMQKKAIRFPI
jgi:hypothetical protein